jgi:anti-sigma regulatory factor (Ser/Thr protein kinase)
MEKNIVLDENLNAAFTSIGYIIVKHKEKLKELEVISNVINDICLIIDELVSNIIKYAYNKDKEKMFHIHSFITNNELNIVLYDSGEKFNPLDYNKLPNYDVEDIQDLPIGGLGIKFVKEIADDIEYEFTETNKNKLTVKKKLLFR